MGRPSLAEERLTQILDAVGRCIARFGVEGMTLEQVAAEAGLSRSHVRHYAGNRADLIDRFRRRLIERYAPPPLSEVLASTTPAGEAVVDLVLDREPDLDDYASIDAILAAARHDESMRAEVYGIYAELETFIGQVIAHDHPTWTADRVQQAAYQTLALAYGHWTMSEVGFPASRAAAVRRLLRATLGLPPREAETVGSS